MVEIIGGEVLVQYVQHVRSCGRCNLDSKCVDLVLSAPVCVAVKVDGECCREAGGAMGIDDILVLDCSRCDVEMLDP